MAYGTLRGSAITVDPVVTGKFELAAEMPARAGSIELPGDLATRLRIGRSLLKGTPEPVLGVRILEEVAATTDPSAARAAADLGPLFLSGVQGVPPDPARALKYLRQATDAGNIAAMLTLGRALVKGNVIAADPQAGMALLEHVAQSSDRSAPRAAGDLGPLFLVGAPGVAADVVKARRYLEQAANAGYPAAVLMLGRALVNGDVLPADAAAGAALLESLATTNDPLAVRAAGDLGVLYFDGASGVPADKDRAQRFLTEAADAGNAAAMLKLGRALLSGDVLTADPAAAVAMLERLAATSDRAASRAAAELGRVFLTGAPGVPTDVAKARRYLQQAIAAGSLPSMLTLGEALVKGDSLPPEISAGVAVLEAVAATEQPEALKAARTLWKLYREGAAGFGTNPDKARSYLELAALKGNAADQLKLGILLLSGDGIPPDPVEGVKILTILAKEPNGAEAASHLGTFYLKGAGSVRPDPIKGRLYLEMSAAMGNAAALVVLGRAEATGLFGRRNGAAALKYFQQATDHGAPSAIVLTARIYMNGEGGVPRDVKKGMLLLKAASEKGNAAAVQELIDVYRRGRGESVPKDLAKANQYLKVFRGTGKPDQVDYESFLLSAATAGNVGAYERTLGALPLLSPPLQRLAARRLASVNPNVATYLAQARLKMAGVYAGALDGRLGTATIKAISKACRTPGKGACGLAPLTADTIEFVANNFSDSKL